MSITPTTNPRIFSDNIVLKTLVRKCPKGLKRLLFLSSLIAYATNAQKPDKSFIRNMNHILKLTKGDDSSLEFPMRLSTVMWGDRVVYKEDIDVLTNAATSVDMKRKAAEHITSLVPDWFKYGSIGEIVTDVVGYFTSVNSQQTTASLAY